MTSKKKAKGPLAPVLIPIKKLVTADWNYKAEDNDATGEGFSMRAKLRKNLERNGQIETLIVRELETGFFEVVNGNHRLIEMREIGLTEVWCYNMGPISLVHAKRIAVETNETKFAADRSKLGSILNELSAEFEMDELKMSLPFGDGEIDVLKDLNKFSWENVEDPAPKEAKPSKSSSSLTGGSSGSGSDFEVIMISLPKEVAMQFHEQLRRFKKALYPNEQPEDVSPVLPMEAMLQHLHQIPDNQLIG